MRYTAYTAVRATRPETPLFRDASFCRKLLSLIALSFRLFSFLFFVFKEERLKSFGLCPFLSPRKNAPHLLIMTYNRKRVPSKLDAKNPDAEIASQPYATNSMTRNRNNFWPAIEAYT